MAGISIKGTMVNINSGGSAASGSGAEPEKAKRPKEADNREPPKDMKEIRKRILKEDKQEVNPTAFVLRKASENGTPFCEICEKQKTQGDN
jgi:type VI secretion system secreted protein VgrG